MDDLLPRVKKLMEHPESPGTNCAIDSKIFEA